MVRPRTVSLSPHEMIDLGEEMLKWVEENDPLHISEFWCIHKRYMEESWETMIKRPEFVGYYDVAMRLIGRKYLDKNSNVREGASQRWQRVYYKDLKRHEDESSDLEYTRKLKLIEAEIKLKAELGENVSDDVMQQFEDTLNQLKGLRASSKGKSALISDDKKRSNDK